MRVLSASEAKQNFAATLDAAQREPIVIRRHSRDRAVILSPEAYDRLRGVAVADFDAFCDRVGTAAVERGLTEEKLESILAERD